MDIFYPCTVLVPFWIFRFMLLVCCYLPIFGRVTICVFRYVDNFIVFVSCDRFFLISIIYVISVGDWFYTALYTLVKISTG